MTDPTPKSNLPDSYLVGLWGYCKVNNGQGAICSSPSLMFDFDLPSTLGLSKGPWVERIFPGQAHTLLTFYQKLSKYMAIGYVIVVASAFSTIIIGSISIISHHGSVFAGLFMLVRLCLKFYFGGIMTINRSRLFWLLLSL